MEIIIGPNLYFVKYDLKFEIRVLVEINYRMSHIFIPDRSIIHSWYINSIIHIVYAFWLALSLSSKSNENFQTWLNTDEKAGASNDGNE